MRKNGTAGLSGILAIVLLAAGCAGTPTVPAPATAEPQPASSDARGSIAQLALSMVGVPYRYGGANPREGFDCSGLVYYAYTSNGRAVPRTSQSQYDAALKIPLAQAAQSDLLFFRDQEKLSHVGIYLGDGRFVHAPSSGGTVRVENIDAPYYQLHLVAVGRLLP
jgi:cell wall-associated NlpC family hydrolase